MSYNFEDIKVLVVDDMKSMLELTGAILKTLGFKEVHTTHRSDEAYNLVCSTNPDIIVTDWLMEPIDGLELVRKIRNSKKVPNPYVPVIMMSGFSAQARVERSRDIGVTEFLVKPFTAKDLYTRIAHVIEKPRQFVEADGFFGPDRRRKKSNNYQGPRRRNDDEYTMRPAQVISKTDKDAKDILKKLSDEAKNI